MPRRNLQILFAVAMISAACYAKADSAYRSHYGRMFATFVDVLEQIDRHYVEQVDERNLFEGALEGAVSRLDEYSAYIPPQESTAFRESLDQEFGGIGIEVTWDRETRIFTVTSPMVGTPAYEAGILAGDTILLIDGEQTDGLEIEDIVRRLRGEPGQVVRLTVLHEGETKPREVAVERALINVPNVLGDTHDADGQWNFWLDAEAKIGYVRVTSFGEHTTDELREALDWLRKRKARALVLDLRNNAGGLLTAATATCDFFIPSGRIVSTRGRDRVEIDRYDASGKGIFTQLPMAVLVNRYSASASEIVAACLQDHGRAVIVGERSWGKGTVQNVIPLEEGRSVLKLTTATYWRPSGKNIHRSKQATEKDDWGVRPDEGLAVPLTDDELRRLVEERRRRDIVRPPAKRGAGEQPAAPGSADPATDRFDPQLDKAVEVLRKRLDLGNATAAK